MSITTTKSTAVSGAFVIHAMWILGSLVARPPLRTMGSIRSYCLIKVISIYWHCQYLSLITPRSEVVVCIESRTMKRGANRSDCHANYLSRIGPEAGCQTGTRYGCCFSGFVASLQFLGHERPSSFENISGAFIISPLIQSVLFLRRIALHVLRLNLHDINEAALDIISDMVSTSRPMKSEILKSHVLLRYFNVGLEEKREPSAVNSFANRLPRTWIVGDARASCALVQCIFLHFESGPEMFARFPMCETVPTRHRQMRVEFERNCYNRCVDFGNPRPIFSAPHSEAGRKNSVRLVSLY